MITENDVLLILHNDTWFTPSGSRRKKSIQDSNGNIVQVAESYYKNLNDGGQIVIRVSNHGTSLNTWVRRKADPTKSLQNLSVVFSNGPVSSDVVTEEVPTTDISGNIVLRHLYFVVEQYVYRMENLSISDFRKFIKKIKSLDADHVFQDPFKKKPSKKASRTVLEPQKEDGTPIPASANPVHPRQTVVAKNKDHEVDAHGNVIKDGAIRRGMPIREANRFGIRILRKIVNEEVNKALRRYRAAL